MAFNKVIIGTEVKLDLTADTVTADKLLSGVTAHDKATSVISGIKNALDILTADVVFLDHTERVIIHVTEVDTNTST